jgi:hypothetical protein
VYLKSGLSFEEYVLISDTNTMYLNVEALFKTLQIKCVQNMNSLEGFIDNKKNLYRIDFEKKQITIGKKIINITDSLIREFDTKYISSEIISDAFGLNFLFNPRSLSAILTPNFELPFSKQLRLEKTRENISKLQGKQPLAIDTIIPRNYHYFKFGALDWDLSSTQSISNSPPNNIPASLSNPGPKSINNSINTTANIKFGTELLFGEANFSIRYSNMQKFDIKQIQYNWRWINDDNKVIKQAQLGQISTQSIALLKGTLIGATVSNSPNLARKASGFFTINNITEPNWTVELYINDVLVDFTEADASGLYVFKVPIVYGYTTLRLKFYGPMGEERTEERIMNTPYTFMPANKLDYNLTTGIVQDDLNSRYARAGFNYGLTKNITINGGLEYLSNNPNGVFIPFTSIAFQPFSKMILNLNYIPNQSLSGLMNLYVTKDAFLEVNYSKPIDEQTNRLADVKISFSTPFNTSFFSGFTKINYNSNIFDSFTYNQIDFTVSSYYKTLKINLSSFMNWIAGRPFYISTDLSLSKKLTKNLTLATNTRYNLSSNKIVNIGADLQMRILKLNLIARYSRNTEINNNFFSISANYDLPFSRVGVSSSYNNSIFNFTENALGSLTFGEGYKNIIGGKISVIGKGGIFMHPFLDLNQNNILDNGEKRVLLSTLQISGAKAVISKKDSIVRILNLNAFVNYNIVFSDTDLDYVSLRFKHKTYQVLVDPNQYKHVYVPVIPVGEVSGMIYIKSEEILRGQSRVRIYVYDKEGTKVAETLSEFDGYFNYLGLKPGKYTVRVDEAQLNNLNYKSLPKVHQVTIKVSEYGDIIDGLDFTLSEKTPKPLKE